MPDDFYDQTPDGNVLATEAVMNTIRTADMLFDQIGRLLRPLNVSAAGGLVLGILRDHGSMSPSAAQRPAHRHPGDGDRRARFARAARVRPAFGEPVRPPRPDRRDHARGARRCSRSFGRSIHRHEKAWAGVLTDEELRTYIDLLHRIQDSVASAREAAPDR